jgi:hypothetical protein
MIVFDWTAEIRDRLRSVQQRSILNGRQKGSDPERSGVCLLLQTESRVIGNFRS